MIIFILATSKHYMIMFISIHVCVYFKLSKETTVCRFTEACERVKERFSESRAGGEKFGSLKRKY